jgi:hypothetical protein
MSWAWPKPYEGALGVAGPLAHSNRSSRHRVGVLIVRSEAPEASGTARFRTDRAGLSESRRCIGKPLPAAALTRKGFSGALANRDSDTAIGTSASARQVSGVASE